MTWQEKLEREYWVKIDETDPQSFIKWIEDNYELIKQGMEEKIEKI